MMTIGIHPPLPEKCMTAQDFDWLTFTISLCLALGVVISYLPQHYRIIHRKTSEGISPYFLLLGGTSSSAGFLNILILQKDVLACCRFTTKWTCFVQSLGIIQVMLQWLMFSIIIILFIIYFPTPRRQPIPPEHHEDHPHHIHIPTPTELLNSEYIPPSYTTALSVVIGSLVFFVVGSILSIIFLQHSTPLARSYAAYLGVASMLLAAAQYIPQLWVTWRIKRVASLSIPMMCIQSPGSFLFAYSIAVRPGTNWSTWLTYLCTGVLQACLLGMCVAWRVREKREDRKGKGVAREGIPEETSPLLAERREE